jgi:hypothetical protein
MPRVFAAAGIVDDAFRIFISYKWDDSQAVAEQIFDALSRLQFDVYLDRFRTNPGTNFQERIRAELADKACVLLLDSRNIRGSPWVKAEYAFARLYRLGVMAVDLPGGAKGFPRIRRRFDVASSVGSARFSKRTKLRAVDIKNLTRWVLDNYFVEISRRSRYQRLLLGAASKLAKMAIVQRPDGLFTYTHKSREYIMTVAGRPPDINQFRVTGEAAAATKSASAKAVVIGPLNAQLHRSRDNIEWLAKSIHAAAVDERELFSALARASSGTL